MVAVPPAASEPPLFGFHVIAPVAPTAGAVIVPCETPLLPPYTRPYAFAGTSVRTRFVALNVIAYGVGFTRRTVTVKRLSEPIVGGLFPGNVFARVRRSEEHTSELQSRVD